MLTALLFLTALHTTVASPDTTIRMSRGTAVEVSTYNAAIRLSVGTDDLLRVRGGSVEGNSRTLSVMGDDPPRPANGPIEVTVPAWAKVELDTYNGPINLIGSTARLHASTVNGTITVQGGQGILSLETVGGNVTVTGFRGGQLSVDAVSGAITVSGSSGALELESVNGAIRMRDNLTSALSASTVNAPLEYTGSINPGGRYAFESHNGSIVLTVPKDLSARLRVSTIRGSFTTGIPATTTSGDQNRPQGARRWEEREFTVVYGRGAADISVETFNGSLTIRPDDGRRD